MFTDGISINITGKTDITRKRIEWIDTLKIIILLPFIWIINNFFLSLHEK